MRLLLVCVSCILLSSGAAEDALAEMCQKSFSPYCRQESYSSQNGNEEPRCKLKCDVKVKQAEARLFCRTALPYFVSGVTWTNTEVICDYKALVACPKSTTFVGKCVKYYNKPMKYSDALKTCQNQSANIAVPDNGMQLEHFSELIDPNEVVIWQSNGSAVVIWPLEYHTILPGSIIEVHPDSPLTFFCEFQHQYYPFSVEEYCKTLEKISLKVHQHRSECFLQSNNLYSGLFAHDAKANGYCNVMTSLRSRAAVAWTVGETEGMGQTLGRTRAMNVFMPSSVDAIGCRNTGSYSDSMYFLSWQGKEHPAPNSMISSTFSCPINRSPLTDYRVVSYGVDGFRPMGLGNELPIVCKVGDDSMIKTRNCESGWDKFVRYGRFSWCYKFVKKVVRYDEAQNDCNQMGARITSVEGIMEMQRLIRLTIDRALEPYNLKEGSVYVGAKIRNECKNNRRNCDKERLFEWDDGFVSGVFSFRYLHLFATVYPSNENYLELFVSYKEDEHMYKGHFNDLNDEMQGRPGRMDIVGFFCGKPASGDY